MKAVPVTTLAPNTYYSRPVFLDEKFVLLTPDAPVTEELIQRLRKWRFPEVFTDGVLGQLPSYQAAVKDATLAPQTIEQDTGEDEVREAARTFCEDSWSFATRFFEEFVTDGTIDLGRVTEWTKKAIEATRSSRDWVMRFAWAESNPDNWLMLHEVRAALLALLIGDYLKAPPHRLIELGNAAMLHDIGMLRMPEKMRKGTGPLSPEDRRALGAHTVLGYRLLKAISAPENVALAALEHHERFDGSGYPRSLVGYKITDYARIIAVGCSYEAMISARPFRPATCAAHEAIRAMLQKDRTHYDERVLKALVYILSVYPVGTCVLLSNGGHGQVVKTDPEKPRCPVVRVLVDGDGTRPTKSLMIQALDSGGVTVVRALNPEEIKGLAGLQH